MERVKMGMAFAVLSVLLGAMLWSPHGPVSCNRGSVEAMFTACSVVEFPPR